MTLGTYYRYFDHCIVQTAFFGSETLKVTVDLDEFEVIKRTPKGVWIESDLLGNKKFILNASGRKWAWPTKEEAIRSFLKRKHRQLKIVTRQVSRAKEAVQIGVKIQAEVEREKLNREGLPIQYAASELDCLPKEEATRQVLKHIEGIKPLTLEKEELDALKSEV